MTKLTLGKYQSYMVKSLEENPLTGDNIRIGVFEHGNLTEFIQYLDISGDLSDAEITELCGEVFDRPISWEHFSCAERFTGAPNRTPPATGDDVIKMYF
jgi:hypothetical protein